MLKAMYLAVKGLIAALLLISLCGCGPANPDPSFSDKKLTGNLVTFVNEQIRRYGGHVSLPNPTNVLTNCVWRFRSDQDGAQVFTDGRLFPQIDDLLKSRLGQADIRTENSPGKFFAAYNIRKAGVGVTYAVEHSPFPDVPDPLLHIIIIRRQTEF